MNTTKNQPVAEQPSEEKSLEVSDNSANESPVTSSNIAENNNLDSTINVLDVIAIVQYILDS